MAENIPNSGDQPQDEKVEQQKEAVKKDAKGLFKSISTFFKELLDFRNDTDREGTIELIKADIPFKGATAWILICSIFIASIGLNANSIPVVIGAMLISPLMGPILGMGMSIAVNDIDTLRKSLINFAVMVVLSVLTAWVFFWLFPLKVESSELLARTKPDIRDVLIAFFGGLALIIARTKKGTIASVIFGVAIATALMPPLCTVGFGLAIGKYDYALGAMYLFTINTIFIGLATFLVLKLLRFPMIRYANSAKRKLTARIASILAIVVMVPAIYTFWITLNESNAEQDYLDFKLNAIDNNENLDLRKPFYNYNENSIRLYFNGEVPEAVETYLRKGQLLDQIEDLNIRIAGLETELNEAQKVIPVKLLPYFDISKDAKIYFQDLKRLGYAEVITSNFKKVDTLKTIFPEWKFVVSDSLNDVRNNDLRIWMTSTLKADTLFVKY